jgi:anti-sigma-K factor RskA
MDAETLHELTAAYALDALDPGEREAFEEHLAGCERCRDEVAELSLTAASLAYGVEPVSPPPGLRGRILDAARAERPNVTPLRPRWQTPVSALAAVAACAAIGLGIWNISLHSRLSGSRDAIHRIAVNGEPGSFVVSSGGSAALVLSSLEAAPAGKTYEAWVIPAGKKAIPAGLFRASSGATYVPIKGDVPKGAVVAATVEPVGGSPQPTAQPFVVSMPI